MQIFAFLFALQPFSQLEMDTMMDIFRDYMTLGGMPEVVKMYIDNGHFEGTLKLQRKLLKDYEEDITKYAKETDKAKILAVYNHIATFLEKENKKYQISKVAKGARNREYIGAVDWLKEAGVINPCYCLNNVELPLKGNYNPEFYKLYYHDTGLLIASLDEEAQEQIPLENRNNLFVGANNVLYWPDNTDSKMKGFRAYFAIPEEMAGSPIRRGTPARLVLQKEITTEMESIQPSANSIQKFIRDGQIIIFRDGKYYNVLGGRIQ